MKLLIKRIFRFWKLLIFGGILILLYIVGTFWLENKIETTLASLHAKTSSVYVNLASRTVRLEGLELYPTDGTPYGLHVKKLSVQGIDLYQLWKNKKIIIHEIKADSGKFLFDQSLKKDSSKNGNTKLIDFTVQNLSLSNIITEVRTDTILHVSATLDFHATEIIIKTDSLKKVSYSAQSFDGDLKRISVSQNAGMYGLTVGNIHVNSPTKIIAVDSILLIPHYSKFEFARKKGEQVGRVSLSVPKLTIEGFEFYQIFDSTFIASKIKIESFDLHSFKDKRVPFLRDYNIPLPMESFLKLPFDFVTDSLIIKESRVTIEEIPEKGTESGKVTIEHINASCPRVSNRYKKEDPKFVVLRASGWLMGSGELKADFSLPLDGSPTYLAKGSLVNLPFEKLNAVLENMVRFRIESGKLNQMKFEFQYNDLESIGTMEIDYEGLKVTGLKKKNDDTSEIKTLLANALVKDDKGKNNTSKQKRTGSIYVERDRKRYIFNVWWKSIQSGLKSTVLGLSDKPPKEKSKSKK